MVSRILISHDFSEASNRALAFAASLAESTGAELDLVYVLPDIYDGRSEPSLALPALMPDQGERYLRFLQQELQQVVTNVLGERGAKVSCHVQRGDPVKRIEALAKELSADTICLGATGKGAVARVLLGSTSQLVLRTSSIPVLIVP